MSSDLAFVGLELRDGKRVYLNRALITSIAPYQEIQAKADGSYGLIDVEDLSQVQFANGPDGGWIVRGKPEDLARLLFRDTQPVINIERQFIK